MEKRECLRCGAKLAYGSLVYRVQVKVFADFDGVILDSEKESPQPLEQLLEQIQKADPKELEKEVYEAFTFVLCKSCRDRFVDETRHPWEGPFCLPKGPRRVLH